MPPKLKKILPVEKQEKPEKSEKLKKLGEGSFGCVVSRPLQCSGVETIISSKADMDKKQVSKLFYEKNKYENEVRLGKLSKKIDPSEERILVPSFACAVTKDTLNKPANINAISKCENLASISSISNLNNSETISSFNYKNKSHYMPQKVWQLVMPYGGIDIDYALEKRKNQITVKSLAKMILPIFEAVILLNNKREVHQDIKVENVLVYKSKAILIDFSLMLPYNKIYTPSNYNKLKRKYKPYPPEYYLASLMIKHAEDFKKFKSEEIKAYFIEHYKNHLERIQSFFYPYYTLNQLIEESNYGSLLIELKNNYKILEQYVDKIDIYSVGTLLSDISSFINHPLANVEFVKLMKGILHPDPRQRMSSQEALTLCRHIAGIANK